jgi:3-(methylthio)propanoyl-CoA dehydrogenase
MALMNGARVGIAGQSLGIAEAAYRLARTYANSRKQFGGPIERLPAVSEMITDMKIAVEAARALTYETSYICDLENRNTLVMDYFPPDDKDEVKQRKDLARTFKRLNGMLTPMTKYYASEMCVRVADTALQVLGGSGYMQDYPAERYLRDARITTIYEGTSQLQVVAAVRGVCSGAFERRVAEFEELPYGDPLLAELRAQLVHGREQVLAAIAFVKSQSMDYLDLMGRKLVDAAAAVYIGHLLLQQASGQTSTPRMPGAAAVARTTASEPTYIAALRQRKQRVARRFIQMEMPRVRSNCEHIGTGDRTPLEEYDILAGPVPAKD